MTKVQLSNRCFALINDSAMFLRGLYS